MIQMTRAAAWATAAALLLPGAPALAEDAAPQGGWTIFGWQVTASLQPRVAPDYIGSKKYSLGPGGSISLSRPGAAEVFSAPDDSPSLTLIGDHTLSAGVDARWRSGRDDKDALRGFDKIDWAIEPGLFVNWWPTDSLRLRGEVRHGFGGNHAWLADLGADAVHRDRKWVLSVGPRLHLADSKFTRTYFQVTPAEAARSPFAIGPYAADGAFTSAGALATAEYHLSSRWSVLGDVDYRRLMGKAGDSPIVAKLGSRDQFSAALGVGYAFGR